MTPKEVITEVTRGYMVMQEQTIGEMATDTVAILDRG